MNTYLITGGSGSLGTALTHHLLAEGHKVRTVSRNEHRIEVLKAGIPEGERERFSGFVGDVRDRYRLWRAFQGVDFVIHAAAMKIIAQCEYDPEEAVRTNIDGTIAVANACLDTGVKRAVFISSDKACLPNNLYGMTKACGERVWMASNRYSAGAGTKFVAVRYGNIWNSNGSVVRKWMAANGSITMTDPEATRFHFKIDDAVKFVLDRLENGTAGSLYVPRLPCYRLGDLAACFPQKSVTVTGLQFGEKRHELMLSEHEAKHAVLDGPYIRVDPTVKGEGTEEYKSGGNWPDRWRLSVDDLRAEVAWLSSS